MGAVYGAAADVERRGEPAVHFEVLAADCGADDVDDGVDGSDFVEVNAFDGHRMDAGFGFAEKLEGSRRTSFYRIGEQGRPDDAEDCGERAMSLVCVLM